MTNDKQPILNRLVTLSPCLPVSLAIEAFAARVIAEMWLAPLPLVAVIGLVIACVLLTALILRLTSLIPNLKSLIFNLKFSWPALLLLIYVVWPTRDLTLAASIAVLAILTAAISNISRYVYPRLQSLIPRPQYLIFITLLIAYILTLQKDILPADSGEFQLVASQLGVAHPPGYPLYTMVGKLFTMLTPGHPALGLNLMSAVLAAAALALVFTVVRRIVGGTAGAWGGLAAALALGTSTTFWAQATTANIRMPTMFLMAWCLYEIQNFKFQISNYAPHSTLHALRSPLTRFALALSLGLGHHPLFAFAGLFFVLYIILVDPKLLRTPRRWPGPLAAFALGQLVWLYLPIRGAMGALFAPSDLTTPQGFLYHVLAKGFGGDMFAFVGPAYLSARLAVLPTIFSFQFNLALLIASAFGALVTVWRDWHLAVLLWGGWAISVFVAITYRAPQTVEYMMPAYVLQVIALGIGTSQLVKWSHSLITSNAPLSTFHFSLSTFHFPLAILPAGILLACILNGISHAPGYIQLSGDHSTRDYVAPILQDAPPGALILADWHWATPMQYLQIVEGVRLDVEVEYVYPLGGVDYAQRWLQRIDEEIARRPVIVTQYFGEAYSATKYTFQPMDAAFRVLDQPTYDQPAGFTPAQLNFGEQVSITGYHLDRATFHAGQTAELTLAWRPLASLDHNYSLKVCVRDATGRFVAQRDLALPVKTYTPGEVSVARFILPLVPELPPGQYQIVAGAYYITSEGQFRDLEAGGQTLATLTEFSLDPLTKPTFTLHPLDARLENGVRLVGVDYDRSDPATLRVYLHWQDQRPISNTQYPISNLRLQSGDATDERPLPNVPSGAYFTTVHDFDAAKATGRVSIEMFDASGEWIESAGVWGISQRSVELPSPAPGSRYVLLGDQFALTNVSAQPSPTSGRGTGGEGESLHPGSQLQLDLTFIARQSLVSDNSLSVRLLNQDGAWWLAQDTKPALDTVRTLKWITGSRVDDPHRFTLPADAAPGQAGAHLKVYDEFRQTILPPLDARMGDSVLIGMWEVKP